MAGPYYWNKTAGRFPLQSGSPVLINQAAFEVCCCGGDCPEGCERSGDCCISTDSQLRVTVEIVECTYVDSILQTVTSHKIADAVLPPPFFSHGLSELGEYDKLYWGKTNVPETYVVDGDPSSCDYTDPGESGVPGPTSSLNVGYSYYHGPGTGQWSVGLLDKSYGNPWWYGDNDIGEGDCLGITMESFIYPPGWDDPSYGLVYKYRVTIEVIDNDDCIPATYTTRAVAHIRGGNGGSTGDWEIGLGTSTSSISSDGQYAWPNDTYVEWSLDYSGAGGDLTLTVGTGSCVWTPGAAIPNDASNWRLRLDIYVAADTATGDPDASRLGTQYVSLAIDGDDHPFDDMLVESDPDAVMSDSAFILPYQLGNQAWTVDGEIKLGWTGSIPLRSRLQAVLRLQQED